MTKFPLDLASQVILVNVTLTGPVRLHNIYLILDTGATFTMISPEILLRIGLDPTKSEKRRTICTASGIEYVPFLTVPSIKAIGAERKNIEVCAHTLPPNIPARGLLGLNFLRHFNIPLNFLDNHIGTTCKEIN
ncbi:MAG: clan AA aspartic protease [Candidatus Omnitrophica bacterium]|nr:clan AA aspartic protease [Candidatus Omnitrophota bacterium]